MNPTAFTLYGRSPADGRRYYVSLPASDAATAEGWFRETYPGLHFERCVRGWPELERERPQRHKVTTLTRSEEVARGRWLPWWRAHGTTLRLAARVGTATLVGVLLGAAAVHTAMLVGWPR